MAALTIRNLSKSFASRDILRDVSFSVTAGSLIAILGKSGSGKTTLLRLIAGFERADAGSILIGDITVAGPDKNLPPEARGVGYVAQEGALFPHLSVAANITFGLPRAQRRDTARVDELLDLVGLPAAYARRAPQLLSGGEQQRVALARALAPRPKLILLDEPFSALDAGLRAETRHAVAAALRAAGATAILVTHDQDEALSMGKLVGVLRDGRLAQFAAPATLYRHPADPALAGFVGDAVLQPGQAADGQVNCALGLLKLAPGAADGQVEVLIRPEQIKLSAAPITGGVPAQIADVAFFGHDAMVRLRIEGSAGLITARIFSHTIPPAGDALWLTVEGDVFAYPS